jgi:Family of unknown function (DUF6525)
MTGNSSSGRAYRTTTANAMRAFDRLPPEVRIALANAADNWVPQRLVTMLRRDWSVTGVLRLIETWNAQELAKRERDRARAVGPYKGNQPDPGIVSRSTRQRPR